MSPPDSTADDPLGQITAILAAAGDASPLDTLMPLVHQDLKRLARAQRARMQPGETLSTTALVNEAYLKLRRGGSHGLHNREHFFSLVARAMRQILIDHARARVAGKRGGVLEQVTLGGIESDPLDIDMLDLERALCDLGEVDEGLRQLVELRYFAGLTLEEIAALRGVSLRTANRDWQRARALLAVRLDDDGG